MWPGCLIAQCGRLLASRSDSAELGIGQAWNRKAAGGGGYLRRRLGATEKRRWYLCVVLLEVCWFCAIRIEIWTGRRENYSGVEGSQAGMQPLLIKPTLKAGILVNRGAEIMHPVKVARRGRKNNSVAVSRVRYSGHRKTLFWFCLRQVRLPLYPPTGLAWSKSCKRCKLGACTHWLVASSQF